MDDKILLASKVRVHTLPCAPWQPVQYPSSVPGGDLEPVTATDKDNTSALVVEGPIVVTTCFCSSGTKRMLPKLPIYNLPIRWPPTPDNGHSEARKQKLRPATYENENDVKRYACVGRSGTQDEQ